ncbi:hypothetical protein [Brevundimonas sp.]|uniref:hypothetical protein n=1 Tax=Brevundimonas sp. TaxID=1871086 RepID=UPI0028A20B6F|nr:hypothetical protein [Brevundimonas sp.]
MLASIALVAALQIAEPTALAVLRDLDLTSFPNSTGPARLPGRKHPRDWNFRHSGTDKDWTFLTRREDGRDDWTIGLRIIRRSPDGIIACFHDRAQNGGSYSAASAIRIVATVDGYRAAEQGLNEPTCPPMPGQG